MGVELQPASRPKMDARQNLACPTHLQHSATRQSIRQRRARLPISPRCPLQREGVEDVVSENVFRSGCSFVLPTLARSHQEGESLVPHLQRPPAKKAVQNPSHLSMFFWPQQLAIRHGPPAPCSRATTNWEATSL